MIKKEKFVDKSRFSRVYPQFFGEHFCKNSTFRATGNAFAPIFNVFYQFLHIPRTINSFFENIFTFLTANKIITCFQRYNDVANPKTLLPMKKISTQQTTSVTMTIPQTRPAGPKKSTIAFLKQFARVYTPAPIGSIVIN